jgi:hypothetical protein
MSLFWLRRPHVPLILLLACMVAVFPAIERSGLARCLLNAVVVTGIVLALWLVHVRTRMLRVIIVFGALALIGQVVHEMRAGGPAGAAALASAAAQTVFYAGAASLMCGYMLRDSRATLDELFAAGAGLMLLALAWASLYWCIGFVDPAAFVIAQPSVPGRGTWLEYFYLSMTTVSTTGFGDILPVSSAARSAVILEQFVGVLYVALVISRLAGFAARRSRRG